MIKKIHCKCVKLFDKNFTIVPDQKIKDNELLHNYIHHCVDYDVEGIFDLRSQIINNNINKVYFYMGFKRDINVYMNLHSRIEGTSFISEFNREKRKKNLDYNKKTNSFEISCKNNYVYLGNLDINFRNMAYESTNCLSTFVSKNGGGFYSFNLLIDKEFLIPYVDLIISEEPLHNQNIQRLQDIYPSSENREYLEYQKNEYQDFIRPSAPPVEEIDHI